MVCLLLSRRITGLGTDAGGEFRQRRVCCKASLSHVSASSAADECTPLQFQSIVPMIHVMLALPRATTLARAESLGLMPRKPPGARTRCRWHMDCAHPVDGDAASRTGAARAMSRIA
ncbi:MAG: hypothetical protein JWR07_4834 [Nevskia sp.]|nr:hypothetical protein [Nevskia sp.]